MAFYITGVDNQSDTQVEFTNPAAPSEDAKIPPTTTMPGDPPVLVPDILFNPPEERSISTTMGVFYIRSWENQLLSFLEGQGENPLTPASSGNFQLVVKTNGGISVLS